MSTLEASRLPTRRQFLRRIAGGAGLVLGGLACAEREKPPAEGEKRVEPFFKTRGIVLVPQDFTLSGWPERAKRAGLTTLGLHHGESPRAVLDFVRSERGAEMLESCRRLGLSVEYELHAMRELLPRDLFAKDPDFFRMNEKGERTPDANLCVHSESALEVATESAVELSRALRPTTGRHFLWGDDGQPWCRCPKCAPFSDSDQALILENRLATALRRENPQAQVAHLAYARTLEAPGQVKPEPGVFLEFAPIEMKHRRPSTTFADPVNRDFLDALDGNLAIFPAETAQALEYWLDDSLQSGWKKPPKKLSFSAEALRADLDAYGRRGIRHVTTFAVFLDADYVARYGEPAEVEAYGRCLAEWRPSAGAAPAQ